MNLLGNGLSDADHDEDALSVREAELSMLRRLGAPEEILLVVQGNIGNSYQFLGRLEEALSVRQDVYSGFLKLKGEEDHDTLREANNYAHCLLTLRKCKEAKSLLRKTISVTQRARREGEENTLRLRWNYARALSEDDGATLDDLREAVTTFEEIERIARRVLGGAHPIVEVIERRLPPSRKLLLARAALSAHGVDVESIREAMAAMTPGDA
tara:strand:+ start:138 stop:773 length:636 start_codon:yes stop_codon:yes gene_type:complete